MTPIGSVPRLIPMSPLWVRPPLWPMWRAVIGDWELVAVVNDDADRSGGGATRSDWPSTAGWGWRRCSRPTPPRSGPSILIRELAKSMDADGQERILVTTPGGRLIGLVRRAELDGH